MSQKIRHIDLLVSFFLLIVGCVFIFYDYHTAEQSAIQQQALIESLEEMAEAEAREDTVDDIDDSRTTAVEKTTQTTKSVSVTRSMPLISFLKKQGLTLKTRKNFIRACAPYYKKKKVLRGQKFYLTYDKVDGKNTLIKIIFINGATKFSFVPDNTGQFVLSVPPETLPKNIEYTHGKIRHSLYLDAQKSGLSKSIVNQIIHVFSYSVDFQRSLRRGDTFETLIERYYDTETGYRSSGTLLYTTLFIAGGPKRVYRFADNKNIIDFFNEGGQSVRRALLQTPVKGARISSGFGKRRHPILGYTKMHRGIDFAAPYGTPIFASGDGKIQRIGRLGAYGNYILVKHNKEYATAYAHLSRFAKNVKKGSWVKQGDIIGYIGATGRATAPHLHYEVHYKGKQINPLKMRMPARQRLRGQALEKFLEHKKLIDNHAQALKRVR